MSDAPDRRVTHSGDRRRLDRVTHPPVGSQPFMYVWSDATYVHVRENRHVVSKAVVVATGLRADGHREVLDLDVGDSENETFWREYLPCLCDGGLGGVRLVVSDANAGFVKSDPTLFPRRQLATLPSPRHRTALVRSSQRRRAVRVLRWFALDRGVRYGVLVGRQRRDGVENGVAVGPDRDDHVAAGEVHAGGDGPYV